ncbi:hypothetical protein [Pseudoalteromonas luteoviolacea]|uniref:Uncharacterized protein n=1 Tax=Pseudoalteromonas luteoviolacea DSM 6061 TaxID=1365250 RepID=A0A166UE18_9GAMM|nr:hypothetical protein [Pseudoalteromonas luteoviolacea]KZN29860.1 hypothetical protein N475_25125 [Pseudoalteromonas luteoviolacea DSM 6061]MBE0388778.1 hypothetical protein [Pseudoalteromonas luteoviolacea DSM 6061]
MNKSKPSNVAQFDQNVFEQTLPQISHYYRQSLLSSSETIQWFNERLETKKLCLPLLGYANRALGNQLLSPRSKEGQLLRGALKRLGILKPSGHERLSGSALVLLHCGSALHAIYGERIGRCSGHCRRRQWLVFQSELEIYKPPPDLKTAYLMAISLQSKYEEANHA